MRTLLSLLLSLFFTATALPAPRDTVYVRTNLVGYRPADQKVALAFSKSRVTGDFSIREASSGREVFRAKPRHSPAGAWKSYPWYYELDFSAVRQPGRYVIRMEGTGDQSAPFTLGDQSYKGVADTLLVFMRQQRCGYNPYLDVVCHQRDGRAMFGPIPDSTYVDATGGWHDAGDQLKYLITGSNATARMLLAYELYPSAFGDQVNALGQPGANGIPDVLDEARWGLEWLLKLHPGPGQLIHQVADDRDHVGWKWPDNDTSDYGWGKNSYRVAYFATGAPQGLRQYKSQATGLGNLAGRYSAATAIGSRVFRSIDPVFADACLRASQEVYAMGREKEGFQQGNSFGAPYRYTEDTWADDMEWGAAELNRQTGKPEYLQDAIRYAGMIRATSWMGRDTTDHYQMYPFMNVGHYALAQVATGAIRDSAIAWYRDGLEKSLHRSETNSYRVGFPFIWCSNNLATNLVTQALLYEKLTGDARYRPLMFATRDWLLGRNPWGTSMFTGLPAGAEYPLDVHTSIWALSHKEVPGGLIDGPVYATIFNQLKGLTLLQPDEMARFQTPFVVYHDDIGDYSTNEPTMDGTADAVLIMAAFAAP